MKIAIIDYQMSNLFSVKHACDAVGVSAEITSNKNEIGAADGLILPGVGAFGDAMINLARLDLIDVIKSSISQGKSFLGVCLGMQLLMSDSTEFGNHQGLNIIPGTVKKFPRTTSKGTSLKIPQIGWNTIYPKTKNNKLWEDSPLRNIQPNAYMYFVHSFYVQPEDSSVILSLTNYDGFEYCSSLVKGNVYGFQFHPEKSGREGIKLYKDWAETIRKY